MPGELKVQGMEAGGLGAVPREEAHAGLLSGCGGLGMDKGGACEMSPEVQANPSQDQRPRQVGVKEQMTSTPPPREAWPADALC